MSDISTGQVCYKKYQDIRFVEIRTSGFEYSNAHNSENYITKVFKFD